KRRETVLRELLAQRQSHQQRRGKSIRRQLRDWSAPGGEVLVTHRERLQYGGDQRPGDRLLLLCFLRDGGEECGTQLLFPEHPLTFTPRLVSSRPLRSGLSTGRVCGAFGRALGRFAP